MDASRANEILRDIDAGKCHLSCSDYPFDMAQGISGSAPTVDGWFNLHYPLREPFHHLTDRAMYDAGSAVMGKLLEIAIRRCTKHLRDCFPHDSDPVHYLEHLVMDDAHRNRRAPGETVCCKVNGILCIWPAPFFPEPFKYVDLQEEARRIFNAILEPRERYRVTIEHGANEARKNRHGA